MPRGPAHPSEPSAPHGAQRTPRGPAHPTGPRTHSAYALPPALLLDHQPVWNRCCEASTPPRHGTLVFRTPFLTPLPRSNLPLNENKQAESLRPFHPVRPRYLLPGNWTGLCPAVSGSRWPPGHPLSLRSPVIFHQWLYRTWDFQDHDAGGARDQLQVRETRPGRETCAGLGCWPSFGGVTHPSPRPASGRVPRGRAPPSALGACFPSSVPGYPNQTR